MEERTGIFAGDDPLALAQAWLETAEASEINDANAMSLATVDANGMPNVRVVLLKEIDETGLVFYTNFGSAKAQELTQAGKAAIVLHWKSLGRQVRVRGAIEKVSDETADAYFASRPLQSRYGAWASKQSQPLESRAVLESRLARLTSELGPEPPRPDHWGGFRLIPLEVEFWANGEYRLHDRFRWQRNGFSENWAIQRLNP